MQWINDHTNLLSVPSLYAFLFKYALSLLFFPTFLVSIVAYYTILFFPTLLVSIVLYYAILFTICPFISCIFVVCYIIQRCPFSLLSLYPLLYIIFIQYSLLSVPSSHVYLLYVIQFNVTLFPYSPCIHCCILYNTLFYLSLLRMYMCCTYIIKYLCTICPYFLYKSNYILYNMNFLSVPTSLIQVCFLSNIIS